MRIGSLELQGDAAPARWIVDRIHDFAVDVGSVIPEGFETYVRLFHPAVRRVGEVDVPVRWDEIAAANGRTVHPLMQWPNISGAWEHSGNSVPGLWESEPEVGTLPRPVAGILSVLLAAHTATPKQIWFCVWDGWGRLKLRPDAGGWLASSRPRPRRRPARTPSPTPPVRLPRRAYFLLSGPIEAIAESMEWPPSWQSANLWWPDDRAWCVATEIDFAWTYVGGTTALCDELLSHPGMEARPARLDHAVTHEADRINPPPPGRPR